MTPAPTKVVFRKWKNGDIIALFPRIPGDVVGMSCMSYMRVGQHSGAIYGWVIQRTTPAKPAEYIMLKRELQRMGYVLNVATKSGFDDVKARIEEAAVDFKARPVT